MAPEAGDESLQARPEPRRSSKGCITDTAVLIVEVTLGGPASQLLAEEDVADASPSQGVPEGRLVVLR